MMRRISVLLVLFMTAWVARAQRGPLWLPHVPFVGTSPQVAAAMLELAGAKPSDVVYDLGCGDGRIVILAARRFGARGAGVDIDPERIREANESARIAGVTGRVRFVLADLFHADIHDATIVTMFLLPSLNVKLRPMLLRDLKPGTRIVTHSFDFGDWKPERQIVVDGVPVYLWTVPQVTSAAGQVQMEDGSQPPISASLEQVCNGHIRFAGYTDAQGAFSTAVEGEDCSIRAVLPGYRSDVRPLRAPVGTIVLHRTSKSEASLISAGAKSAPPAAREEFLKGRKALAEQKPDVARSAFEQAVKIHPQFAAAWSELAAMEEAEGHLERSRDLYRKAISLEPRYLSPYLGLIQVAMHQDRWAEIAEYSGQVVGLDPESFPEAWLYHAIGSLTLGKLEPAERSARAAMRLDTAHQLPRAEYILGLVLAARGDPAGARDCLAHYIEADPKAPDIVQIRERIGVLEAEARR